MISRPAARREQLACVEEEGGRRLVAPCEVSLGGLDHDEDALFGQNAEKMGKQVGAEVADAEDEVEGAGGEWLLFQIEFERGDRHAGGSGPLAGEGEADGGNIGKGHIEAAVGEPDGIAATAAGYVDGAAAMR